MDLPFTLSQFPVLIQVGFLVTFSFLLVKATDLTIGALNRLSWTLKIGTFAITAFLLALATSLPELLVSVAAALEGNPNLALGIIVGSNIADLSLVIGGAAIVGGTIPVVGRFLKRDLFYTFLAGALPLLLLLDKRLGMGDGVVLLMVYGVYNYTVLREQPKVTEVDQQSMARRILQRLYTRRSEKQLVWLVVSIAALIFSADMVVQSATALATSLHLPPLLIGLILVAVGTSLPEFSFEIRAIEQRKVAMVFGNLLGSVVANSTLILGITVMIKPIQLEAGLQSYLVATLAFLVIFLLFWIFVKSKKKLERWEGAVLGLLYFIFVILEFWQNKR